MRIVGLGEGERGDNKGGLGVVLIYERKENEESTSYQAKSIVTQCFLKWKRAVFPSDHPDSIVFSLRNHICLKEQKGFVESSFWK